MSEVGSKQNSQDVMLFKITGVDDTGATKSIALEATDERQAIEFAKRQRIHPTHMTKVKQQTKKRTKPDKNQEDEQFSKAIEASLVEKQSSDTQEDRLQKERSSPFRQSIRSATIDNTVEYDPAIIQQYARRMYKKAERITVEYTVAGGLFFVVVGFLILTMLAARSGSMGTEGSLFIIAISFLFGAFIGYQTGVSRAFWCKFAAHQALCQMHIEANTRTQRGNDVDQRA